MPAWPAYARIDLRGYARERQPAAVSMPTESGPPKVSKVKSRVLIAQPVTVWLDSKADYQAFHAWLEDEVGGGEAWFDWIDPVDGRVKQARIRGGEILEEEPVSRHLGIWRITLVIEAWSS
jgi:hypothetical protein